MPRTKIPQNFNLTVDYQLHDKQMEVMRDPRRFKVIAWGRRTGKTEMETVKGLYGDGSGRLNGAIKGDKVWWVAPDYPRADVGWQLAKRFTRNMPQNLMRISAQDRKLEFPSGGFFQVKSGFDPNSLRGEGLDHVTMDEAAFMAEEAWTEGIRPALADRKGSADFISTPQGFNFFYDLYERGLQINMPEWQAFRGTSYDNPYVDDEEIEAARKEYEEQGKMHVFQQEFLAQFLEGAGMPVFLREWWANGRNRFDPENERLLRSCIGTWIAADTANRDQDEAARTVFIVGKLTPQYDLLITDAAWGRWAFNDLYSRATNLAYRNRGYFMNSLRYMFIEDAASGIALIQTLQHSGPSWLRGKVIGVKPKPKEVNWNEASVWCARNFVKLPYPDESNAHWLRPMEEEIFNVNSEGTGTKFFDFADSFSILINQIKLLFASAYRGRGAA